MKRRVISAISGAVIAILTLSPAAYAQETMSMPAEPYHQMTPAEAAGLDAPELPAPDGELVTVRTLADERLAEFDIGPLELMSGTKHLRIPIQMAQFPVDGWIQGRRPRQPAVRSPRRSYPRHRRVDYRIGLHRTAEHRRGRDGRVSPRRQQRSRSTALHRCSRSQAWNDIHGNRPSTVSRARHHSVRRERPRDRIPPRRCPVVSGNRTRRMR